MSYLPSLRSSMGHLPRLLPQLVEVEDAMPPQDAVDESQPAVEFL